MVLNTSIVLFLAYFRILTWTKMCLRGLAPSSFTRDKSPKDFRKVVFSLHKPPCRACWGMQCSLEFLCSREGPGHELGQILPSGFTSQVGAVSEHWSFVLHLCLEVQVAGSFVSAKGTGQHAWKKKLFGIMHFLLKFTTSHELKLFTQYRHAHVPCGLQLEEL